MSLRRAARVIVCVASIFSAVSADLRADESAPVEHAPEMMTKVYAVGDLVLPLAAKSSADFEWLVDLLELRTGADCWNYGGGQGVVTVHEKTMSLIVRQTQAVHERIAAILDEVRGTGDLALCVELQVIHGDLDACNEGKSHRTAQGLVDAAGRQRLLTTIQGQSDSQILAAPKITFFNGRSGSIEISGPESPMALEIHGVVSKDNRYARLWLDAKLGEKADAAELLVPEGHTAVRKLPADNTWLLVTSYVINADEPQMIAPLKNTLPHAAEQKRYLVPAEDLPDPTELTVVPQFKAQAEGFGLSVAVQHTKAADQESHCTIVAGEEKACLGADDKPALAKGVEHLEYQVAHAEPRLLSNVAIELPGRVSLDLEDCPVASTHDAGPSKTVLHGFVLTSGAIDPPARLDVCLDHLDGPTGRENGLQVGQVFERVFVSPTPDFPLHPTQAVRVHGHSAFSASRLDLTNPESWRQAIRMKKESPYYGTLIAEPATNNGTHANIVIVPNPSPAPRVQQVSGESERSMSVELHVKTAAVELEELGLLAEARLLRGLLHSLEVRAQERCQQIDQEIGRLKAARAKLEELSQRSASTEPTETR